jgi:hypothetical protein
MRSFSWKDASSHVLHNILWVPEDERKARIRNSAGKKIMLAAGIKPLTSW